MIELDKATRAIDGLASEAKILALNSRIEAGRAGQGRAFSVVAVEMRQLSTAVAATNTKVRQHSGAVTDALAQVVARAEDTRGCVQRFSTDAGTSAQLVLGCVDQFREEARDALGESDAAMAEAVRSSQDALSHLQFQDVVAQGLLRLDGRLRELQIEIADAAGIPAAAADIEPPSHSDVGGDKTVL